MLNDCSEYQSVSRNGSWVTMIVNTSAGSSGARRTQPWRPRSGRARTRWAEATGGAIAVIVASVRARRGRRRRPSRLLGAVAKVLGGELGVREGGGGRLLPGDG